MDYKTFTLAVEQDAALRRKQVLQPVGGKGIRFSRRHIPHLS
jgi:hypothetical protein